MCRSQSVGQRRPSSAVDWIFFIQPCLSQASCGLKTNPWGTLAGCTRPYRYEYFIQLEYQSNSPWQTKQTQTNTNKQDKQIPTQSKAIIIDYYLIGSNQCCDWKTLLPLHTCKFNSQKRGYSKQISTSMKKLQTKKGVQRSLDKGVKGRVQGRS